jgi:tetracycline 7-halogenase / FADH2 O2-dependent halogenase
MHVEIAIVGSGFSGSLLAYLLASHGKQVALIDSRPHPRFSIGESSTPIADLLLEKIADDFALEPLRALSRYGTWKQNHPELNCGKKRGFSYFQHHANQTFVDHGDHRNAMLVTASVDEYRADTHWLRADVDAHFYQLATSAGVTTILAEVCSLQRTVNAKPTVAGWELSIASSQDAQSRTLTCDFLIDAGGRGGTLRSKLGIVDSSQMLATQTCCSYGHFVDVGSWQAWLEQNGCATSDYPFNCDAAAQHHLLNEGWLWMLRFDDGRTSVGWTRPQSYNESRLNDGDLLDQLGLAQHVDLRSLFANASLVGTHGKRGDAQLTTTGRLQYRADRIVGSNFALMPTAAAVIDPLHSSGIAHGLSGVYRLGKVLLETQVGSQDRSHMLQKYEAQVTREIGMLDQMVAGCYAAGDAFDLFQSHSMFYFLAAIACEEKIAIGGELGAFWAADDRRLVELCAESFQKISAIKRAQFRGEQSSAAVEKHLNWVSSVLAPWNQVGLIDPAARNMYHYTVAPK